MFFSKKESSRVRGRGRDSAENQALKGQVSVEEIVAVISVGNYQSVVEVVDGRTLTIDAAVARRWEALQVH